MSYRYLGNKRELADWITFTIRNALKPESRIGDPMCGTASISASLASDGYSVWASDELLFPVLHARARLAKRTPPFRSLGGYEAALKALGGCRPRRHYFTLEFSPAGTPDNGCAPRAYFTPENAAKIDGMRFQIETWQRDGVITESEGDLLLHDLILAVNRVANIAGTYGYFRSGWNKASLQPIALRPTTFRRTSGSHRVSRGRIEETIELLDVDALYLDPPYTKRQYAGNYHVLETLARQDCPAAVGEGGLRDWYENYSAFCSKRTAAVALEDILKRTSATQVFISYSEDGLISNDRMSSLLKEHGSLKTHSIPRRRYRSNGGAEGHVREYLHHLTR